MKQFITSDVCLSCDGCCRFPHEKDEWRAKAGKLEEKVIMDNLPEGFDPQGASVVEEGGYLKDKKCHGMFICTFFNPDDHTCAIYHNRPLECKLYPFVLTRRGDQRSVSVHLACPFVQETKETEHYNKHVAYLKTYFEGEDVKRLLEKNPHLFGEYKKSLEELEVVFTI